MRHLKNGRKLKRTSSHKLALMRNLATSLIISEKKSIATTEAKAKELRPYIEKLITRAKIAKMRETQGLLPQGQTIDVHSRRIASKYLYSKAAVEELFEEIALRVADRPGGYTRIIKTGFRKGDSAQTAIIHLVDWHSEIESASKSKKRRQTQAPRPKVKTQADATPAAVKPVENPIEEIAEPEVIDTIQDEETITIAPVDAAQEETVETQPVEQEIESEEIIAENTPALENIEEEEPEVNIKKKED